MNKIKVLALAALFAVLCPAANVTVAESTYSYATGARVTGTLTVSWPAFTSAAASVAAGSLTVPITAGVFSIALEASDTADPAMFYTARFATTRGTYSQQWVVPALAGPLAISDVVRLSVPPVTIMPAQISKVGAAAGDLIYYNGTNWLKLAAGTNGKILSIDTSLAGRLKWITNTGGSGGGVWGSITGLLADQADIVAALAAKQNSLGFTAANVASNLSDLANAATARTNLGLGTAATTAATAYEVPLTFSARVPRTVNAVDLQSGIVTPGSCGSPTIACGTTVDTYGRVTAQASNTITHPGELSFFVDGAGAAITSGGVWCKTQKIAGTISGGWAILADQSGSIVFGVWKKSAAGLPTISDSITASAPPTLTTALEATSSTNVGWTTAIAVGDKVCMTVTSAATVTKASLTIPVTR